MLFVGIIAVILFVPLGVIFELAKKYQYILKSTFKIVKRCNKINKENTGYYQRIYVIRFTKQNYPSAKQSAKGFFFIFLH